MNMIFSEKSQYLDQINLAFRQKQREYALAFGAFLDKSYARKQGTASDDDVKAKRALLALAEVGTGVGKTFPSILALAIAYSINGTRGIYSTYTKSLREEIIKESAGVNAILEMLGFAQVGISALVSRYDIVDMEKIGALIVREKSKSIDINPLIELHQMVVQSEDAGKLFFLSDWIDAGNDYDFLDGPGLSITDLTIAYNDYAKRMKEHKHYADFENRRSDAMNADIIVMTHAMNFLNAQAMGCIINTNNIDRFVSMSNAKSHKREILSTSHRFNTVIDEADRYIGQAKSIMAASFSTTQLANEGKKLNGKARNAFDEALENLRKSFDDLLPQNVDERDIIMNTDQLPILTNLLPIREMLDGRGSLITDDVDKIILTSISGDHGNTNIKTYERSGYHYTIKRLGKEFSMTLSVKWHAGAISRQWTQYNTHAIDSFWLMSGTLFAHDSDDRDTMKLFGINGNRDVLNDPLTIPSSGEMTKLVMANGPTTFWEKMEQPTGDTYVMTQEGRDHITNFVADALKDAVPTIVIVNSYNIVEMLGKHFNDRSDVIIQKRNEKSTTLLKRIRDSGARHVVCVCWEGVNFTHNRKTIYGRVCIPMLPIPPSSNYEYNMFSSERMLAIFGKLRQGVGRVFRQPNDLAEVWIGDPRFALPDNCDIGDKDLGNHQRKYKFDRLVDDFLNCEEFVQFENIEIKSYPRGI